eukprot:3547233-Pyramimonas_sp.AAC.1
MSLPAQDIDLVCPDGGQHRASWTTLPSCPRTFSARHTFRGGDGVATLAPRAAWNMGLRRRPEAARREKGGGRPVERVPTHW